MSSDYPHNNYATGTKSQESVAGSDRAVNDPSMNGSGPGSGDNSGGNGYGSEADYREPEKPAEAKPQFAKSNDDANAGNGADEDRAGTSSDSDTAGSENGDAGTDGESPILGDAGGPLDPILDTIGGTVETATGGDLIGGDGSASSSVNAVYGTILPALGSAGGAVSNEAGSLIQTVGDAVGLSQTADAVDAIVDTLGLGNIGTPDGGGLIAEVVDLPRDALTGDLDGGISDVLREAGETVDGGLSGAVTGLQGDLGSPLIGASFQDDGQGSQGSHLVEADVGPQQDNGLLLDVMADRNDGANHAVDANVGNGPTLTEANLLNDGDALAFPSLGGAGLDSLTGLLGDSATSGSSGLISTDGSVGGGSSTVDVADVADLGTLLDLDANNNSVQQNSSLSGLI